jgi:hypothetical protein
MRINLPPLFRGGFNAQMVYKFLSCYATEKKFKNLCLLLGKKLLILKIVPESRFRICIPPLHRRHWLIFPWCTCVAGFQRG